jgi:CheY-like chemotaxis protein
MLNDIENENVDEKKVTQIMDIITNSDVKAHDQDVVFLTNSSMFKSLLKVHYPTANITITENYKIAARKLDYKIENYKEIDINFIAENATFAYDLFDQNENIVSKAGHPIIKSIMDSLKARGAKKLLYKVVENKKEEGEKFEPIEEEFLTLSKKHEQFKTTANPFSGKKVLIVEDTQLMRVSISKYLDQQGFVSDMAGDGKEAKEKIDNNTYDLILLDLHMPQMNGLELLADMRQKENNTPVVVLSGVTKINVVKAAKQLNISGFLSKPLKLTTLLKKIVEVLFPSIKM